MSSRVLVRVNDLTSGLIRISLDASRKRLIICAFYCISDIHGSACLFVFECMSWSSLLAAVHVISDASTNLTNVSHSYYTTILVAHVETKIKRGWEYPSPPSAWGKFRETRRRSIAGILHFLPLIIHAFKEGNRISCLSSYAWTNVILISHTLLVFILFFSLLLILNYFLFLFFN